VGTLLGAIVGSVLRVPFWGSRRYGSRVIPTFIRTTGMWWGDVMTSLRERAVKQDAEPG
jgi:hypothetical protein